MAKQVRTEQIYDALVDEESFERLPDMLAQAFDARSCVIHWHYSDGTADILSHSSYFSPEQLALYGSHFAPLDPWAQAAARHQRVNEAADLESLVAESEYERSAFYNDYIRAMGDDTYRCIGVRVESPWGSGMVALQRGKSQERFAPEALARLEEDVRHLQRLLVVRGRLAAAERRFASVSAAVDALATALIVVTRTGRVLHANCAAEEMFRREDGLGVRAGLLSARGAEAARALRAAILRAADPAAPQASALA
ncbi:MAG TPA: hypothetical protein VGB08_10280, partial [Allosphingosinicella sp.]